jgi:hypothetical protein
MGWRNRLRGIDPGLLKSLKIPALVNLQKSNRVSAASFEDVLAYSPTYSFFLCGTDGKIPPGILMSSQEEFLPHKNCQCAIPTLFYYVLYNIIHNSIHLWTVVVLTQPSHALSIVLFVII